jgi:succinate dehydrogenase hydrophobic anchor subunit
VFARYHMTIGLSSSCDVVFVICTSLCLARYHMTIGLSSSCDVVFVICTSLCLARYHMTIGLTSIFNDRCCVMIVIVGDR